MKNKLPIIIDTDPGIDDSIALLMAFGSDKLDVKMITTMAGNVPIEKTTRNAIYLRNNFGDKNIPVIRGSNNAIVPIVLDASYVHGVDGLGNVVVGDIDSSVPECAEDKIKELLEKSEEKITIVGLGAMTNLAKLIVKHPEVLSKIEKLYLMVGSMAGRGNVTPYAEFNCYFDPVAVDIILKSNIPVVISPIELGWQTCVEKDNFYKHNTTKKDKFINDMMQGAVEPGRTGFAMHDPSTMNALINPSTYEFKKADITLSLNDINKGQMFAKFCDNGKFEVQICHDPLKAQEDILRCLYGE